MTTMNISLPEGLKEYVDQQVVQRGFGTSSEYVRELIRKDRDRQQLRAMILEGAESPIVGEADSKYFGELRSRVAKGKRKNPSRV